MKTKEEILADVTDRELYELRNKGVTPIIDVDDIYTAMEQYATQQVDAATENHEKEMVEFAEWVAGNTYGQNMPDGLWSVCGGEGLKDHCTTDYLLTKFRQSK